MFSERTQVLLTPAQRRRLEQLAAERQVSVGALIREAVDAYTAVRSRPALTDLLDLGAPVDDWPVMKAEILRGVSPDRGLDQVDEVRRIDPEDVAGRLL